MIKVTGVPPKEFQEACIRRVREVLIDHGLQEPLFHCEGGKSVYCSTLFKFRELAHLLEVYEDIVVMHQGEQYFECYMPEELKSDAALIEGFAARLDRYLSGGPWEGPDEKGLPDLIKEKVKALFRR